MNKSVKNFKNSFLPCWDTILNFLLYQYQTLFFIVTLSLSKKMKTCKNVLFFCFVSIKLHVMQCVLVCWFKNWLRMKILYVRYNILECCKYIFKQETKIEKKKKLAVGRFLKLFLSVQYSSFSRNSFRKYF